MGSTPTIWAGYFARDSPTHAPCCTLRAPSWYGKPKRLNVGPGGGQAPSRTKPGRYRSFQILNNWGRHDVPFSKRALFIWFAPVVKSHGDFNLHSSQWYSAIGASLFHFE